MLGHCLRLVSPADYKSSRSGAVSQNVLWKGLEGTNPLKAYCTLFPGLASLPVSNGGLVHKANRLSPAASGYCRASDILHAHEPCYHQTPADLMRITTRKTYNCESCLSLFCGLAVILYACSPILYRSKQSVRKEIPEAPAGAAYPPPSPSPSPSLPTGCAPVTGDVSTGSMSPNTSNQ